MKQILYSEVFFRGLIMIFLELNLNKIKCTFFNIKKKTMKLLHNNTQFFLCLN